MFALPQKRTSGRRMGMGLQFHAIIFTQFARGMTGRREADDFGPGVALGDGGECFGPAVRKS